MDWQKIIRELAQKRGMSLRQLAIEMEIGNVYLSEVARGAKPASPMLKLKLLTATGQPLGRDELISLLPDDVAAQIRAIDANK